MRRVGLAVITTVLACALATPAAAGPGEDLLRPGERLGAGQALLAGGGRHLLVVQPDGALGLYAVTGEASDGVVRWTSGRGVDGAVLLADPSGDVRLVAPDGAVLWSTGTAGSTGALRLRDDGELVVETPDGTLVWDSGTALAPSTLVGPGRVAGDEVLTSPDGRHLLHVDPEAGVRLTGPDGAVRWTPPSSDAAGPAVALELRADGDLVAVDADGDPVWRSRTAGRGVVQLVLQDDGNLVLLAADGTPVWDAGAPIGPSGMDVTGALAGRASLGSPSGHLGLRVAGGALVATWDGAPFWTSSTTAGATARVQEDGDLVLLDADGAAVWRTGTAGRPGARVVVEEAAVLLVAPNGEVLWQVAAPETLVRAAAPAPTRVQPTDCAEVDGPVGAGDVVRTRSGIVVHPCLAEALDAMVEAARADGIELRGGGWRSPEQQVALRRAHCGPTDADVYQKPASACRPSTARPGSSRHERGLAVDLTSGGRSLTTGSAAYAWLLEHAGAYGLENLPGEPWHWSVDGS